MKFSRIKCLWVGFPRQWSCCDLKKVRDNPPAPTTVAPPALDQCAPEPLGYHSTCSRSATSFSKKSVDALLSSKKWINNAWIRHHNILTISHLNLKILGLLHLVFTRKGKVVHWYVGNDCFWRTRKSSQKYMKKQQVRRDTERYAPLHRLLTKFSPPIFGAIECRHQFIRLYENARTRATKQTSEKVPNSRMGIGEEEIKCERTDGL